MIAEQDLFAGVLPGPFRTIVMDPPWPERGGGGRGAQNHYDVIDSLPAIEGVIRRSPVFFPATDAHLWMWVTDNYLPWGLDLMGRLGFAYKRCAVWVKDAPGLGQYLRGRHELCLFGVKGKGFAVRSERNDLQSVIAAPVPRVEGRRVHSRKPDAFYELVEQRGAGPRLEMFARRERPGWTVWGNEV